MGVTPASVTLTQKGSDTMLELCQIFSEDFHEDYPWINVEVTGGGSGTGISALINGQVDMAQASRAMKASEMTAAQANGVEPGASSRWPSTVSPSSPTRATASPS